MIEKKTKATIKQAKLSKLIIEQSNNDKSED